MTSRTQQSLPSDHGDRNKPTEKPLRLPSQPNGNGGRTVTYLSFGGGPPSAALLILNVNGAVRPKADLVVFADPGSEDPRTYETLPYYERYAERHGIPFRHVAANIGRLYDWVVERSVAIPAFTSKGLGRRQCTERWKIRPMLKLLRQELGYQKVIAQLAMTLEEVWRMRDSPTKYVTNVYPLIELGLTRENCFNIIRSEGLPVPPRSACVFCPLKSMARWRQTFDETPDSFESAAKLEALINERQGARGKEPIYLAVDRIRLVDLQQKWRANGHQQDPEVEIGQCETGHCFT